MWMIVPKFLLTMTTMTTMTTHTENDQSDDDNGDDDDETGGKYGGNSDIDDNANIHHADAYQANILRIKVRRTLNKLEPDVAQLSNMDVTCPTTNLQQLVRPHSNR